MTSSGGPPWARRGVLVCVFVAGLAVGWGSPRRDALDVPVPERLEDARPELRRLVERAIAVVRAAPQEARSWTELGLVYEANGRWDVALEAYERAAGLAPRDSLIALRLATAARFHEGEDAYEARLRAILHVHPANAPALYRLGHLLLVSGELDEAESLFRRLLKARRFVPDAHCGLGEVALQRGEPEPALLELEQAIRLAPDFVEARRLRGVALARLGRAEEAEPDLALEVDPSARGVVPDALFERVPRYSVDLGELLANSWQFQRTGRISLAVETAEAAHALRPESPEAAARLGAAYLADARPYLAVDLLEAAARELPDDAAVAFDLATAWLLLDVPERGLWSAELAVDLDPSQPSAHVLRARALAALGRYDEATEAVARILELDPGNAAAAELASFIALARVQAARR